MSVFFDHADLGYGPIAAHGHADCLSVLVNVDGRHFIVDSGTYDYFTHPDWRNYFRKTRAHNTAELDERDQSEMLGPFLWGHRAKSTFLSWHLNGPNVSASARHDGYSSLDDPVIHERTLNLTENGRFLDIDDSFLCDGKHVARLHFHLDPACELDDCSDNSASILVDGRVLRFHISSGVLEHVEASNDERLGWISGSYHQKTASSCLRIIVHIDGNSSHRTSIERIR